MEHTRAQLRVQCVAANTDESCPLRVSVISDTFRAPRAPRAPREPRGLVDGTFNYGPFVPNNTITDKDRQQVERLKKYFMEQSRQPASEPSQEASYLLCIGGSRPADVRAKGRLRANITFESIGAHSNKGDWHDQGYWDSVLSEKSTEYDAVVFDNGSESWLGYIYGDNSADAYNFVSEFASFLSRVLKTTGFVIFEYYQFARSKVLQTMHMLFRHHSFVPVFVTNGTKWGTPYIVCYKIKCFPGTQQNPFFNVAPLSQHWSEHITADEMCFELIRRAIDKITEMIHTRNESGEFNEYRLQRTEYCVVDHFEIANRLLLVPDSE